MSTASWEGWTKLTYLYEQLDPERFQQLCQALISLEYPGTQCFPVGQRDGGRDAVQMFANPQGGYRIFQVKFVRNPLSIDDVHKWLIETMKGEIPKILDILKRKKGAIEYILVSNVPGTAFPGSGSIDTLNELLNADSPVPIRAWWRDDLDRRCDGHADVRWAYPDMLRGTDLLQALAESIGGDLLGNRLDVLRSFAVEQFDLDNEVRFKQVELSNEILNLFVDVPAVIHLAHEEGRRKEEKRALQIREIVQQIAQRDGSINDRNEPVGAARLLLHDDIAKLSDLVVLEGGPGQGKSTLAQYVCQVHRMRVLAKHDFRTLPKAHQAKSVRFPIKVDLREYATWLSGKNPFSQEADSERPANSSKSLESFISALISERSGGRTFTVDDLSAVARSSSLLIVLDGLDEVAEVRLRNDMVKEIGSAARRMKESAAALQMLVTTRPSALAEVSDFPSKLFQRWTLTRLGRPLIEEYSERWAKSRRLKPKETANLRKTLAEKLDQPHMRDLARNPMQLAILLTVIHTRGGSLPDKRTALYDIYVELFLAREAEKSEIVKKHQEVLIDLHRYLAWVLHSEAETGRALGKIEASRLRELIKEYLISEGRDPAWTKELFTGLAQRVVFLVGAVEGLFEFEVQPLREYFAGRFLYETAPYSPVGNPRRGTKDERFDAVARNTHWLNVTRFYAGCFSKGELPSLVDRLEVLCVDSDLGLTSHPRSLSATLVADWVFSQNPRSLKKVIELILDKDGYRSLLGDDHYSTSGGEPITLPDGCGRIELLERCLGVLQGGPPRDIQVSITALAQKNGTREELYRLWLEGFPLLSSINEKISWIWSGYFLGILNSRGDDVLLSLFTEFDVPLHDEVIQAVIAAGRASYFTLRPDLLAYFRDALFNGFISGFRIPRKSQITVDLLCVALNPMALLNNYHHDIRRTYGENLTRRVGFVIPQSELTPVQDSRIDAVVRSFQGLLHSPQQEDLQSTDGAFNQYIKQVEVILGRKWPVWGMACSLSLVSKRGKRDEIPVSELFDDSVSVVDRVRYARLQAGNAAWWKRQLEAATSEERQIWALVALAFCGPATLAKVCSELDDVVESLSSRESIRLLGSIEQIRGWLRVFRDVRLDLLPDVMSPRLAAILTIWSSDGMRRELVDKYLSGYIGDEAFVHEAIFNSAIERLRSGHLEWGVEIERIKRGYRVVGDYALHIGHLRSSDGIPLEVARKIASNAVAYPILLVRMAEVSMRRALAEKTVPLSKVAERGGWFEEE
ncbi:NACHT domain-containing protein [Streptomyces cocklensis]|uniref:NTPase (NACHT family)-like protein n=1 Tax=Actinacidiphila cocklensis TaxID=887465 RepID=A0A9W4DZU8_9ACTN|nr:NACHT domain-containing protein [Actinacidiphila cocklensis]MDD1063967.1 NACHT domain-containing protein [Actinacidiphila cocklensis]CAG6396889.1 putative NTPase (NACHT family)-like protein [Actinacidiphila cocklensis]